MSYTKDDPFDFGFISQYIRHAGPGGILVSSVGDASELTPTNQDHYYEFKYPAGLISVTITLVIEAAQSVTEKGEVFGAEIHPDLNIFGPTDAIINWSNNLNGYITPDPGVAVGTVLTETFTVNHLNPGLAIFDINGSGNNVTIANVNANPPDVIPAGMYYSVHVDINQENPPDPASIIVGNFSVGENQVIHLGNSPSIIALNNPEGDPITKFRVIDYGGGGGGHLVVAGIAEPNKTWITFPAADINGLKYVGGSHPGTQIIQVEVYDNAAHTWSSFGGLTATTYAPPLAPMTTPTAETTHVLGIATSHPTDSHLV
jgi:hypothetical protein